MLWMPFTAMHVVQGLAVATATEIVTTSDHSTENTIITAVAGIVGIVIANITADAIKRHRGSNDDEVHAKARRLARENAALKRQLKAAHSHTASQSRSQQGRTGNHPRAQQDRAARDKETDDAAT